mmetsp:Transcript_5751/g.13990  ORF Transcript_5751/g.13990 Transcript_5751/m.13990 type:complete len:100 (-) Transcript_5751:133-432(-)
MGCARSQDNEVIVVNVRKPPSRKPPSEAPPTLPRINSDAADSALRPQPAAAEAWDVHDQPSIDPEAVWRPAVHRPGGPAVYRTEGRSRAPQRPEERLFV